MDWTQTYTIIGVNVALIGVLATIVIFAINRLDKDIQKVGEQVNSLGQRVDALGRRLDSHATRTDQRYRMFVDLLKEGRK